MRLMRHDIYENLRMGLTTLAAHKMRSFLTVIGVVLGVWTVMTIASIISGIDVAVKSEIESWGTRTIMVNKFEAGIRIGRRSREERARKPLTYDDAMAIAKLPAVETAVPSLNITNSFSGQKIMVKGAGHSSAAVRLEGTLPEYERTGTRIISEGRYFTTFENDMKQQVCLIGSTVADSFFGYSSPLNGSINIDGQDFRVVGILEKRVQMMGGGVGQDSNNVIYVPYRVAMKIKPNADDVSIVVVARPNQMEEAKNQVTDLLRVRRQVGFDEPDNFSLSTAESAISHFRAITAGVALAMVVISSVGLLVGGIGVMNIMLVSVTERTREIGVRKAIGAKRRDILWQFLIEATTLTGAGGLIGLVAGWLTTFLISLFIPSYVPLWAPIAGLRDQRRYRPDIRTVASHESGASQSDHRFTLRIVFREIDERPGPAFDLSYRGHQAEFARWWRNDPATV